MEKHRESERNTASTTSLMDKFIVRTPRSTNSKTDLKNEGKHLKQTTIESLQRVVVVEEIWHLKSKLTLENQEKNVMVECLDKLGQKLPSKEILISSNIGKVVNKLRKNEDEDISKAAKRVYIKWRQHFKENTDKPYIEVRCDTKSQKIRDAAKKFLAESLQVQRDHHLPEIIEREVFFSFKRFLTNAYRKRMRTLVFALKHQEDLRNKVLSGNISVEDFVKEYRKETTGT